MSDGFLLATSSEGLQTLGSAAQRSFDLIAGTVRSHLGEAAAAVFAEPISTARGAAIEWYAALPGRVLPPAEQTEAMRAALRQTLAGHLAAISALADRIAEKATPDAFWLAEALRNAIEVPETADVWAVQQANGVLQPMLVNWARRREDRRSVRGVLKTLAPSPASALPPSPPVGAPPSLATALPPPAASQPAVIAPKRRALWPLLWLGWLILAAMVAALIWLMIAPCGLRPGPYGQCNAASMVLPAVSADREAMLADITGLEQRLTAKGQACDVQGASPGPLPQSRPAATPDTARDKKTEGQTQDSTMNDAELDRRLAEHKVTAGAAITISLVWLGRDDLDLKLKCPDGNEVDFRHKPVPSCPAILDVDANFPIASEVDNPVENISVAAVVPGRYVVTVRRASDQPPHGDTAFRLFVRQKGMEPQTFDGRLLANGLAWTTDLEITPP